MNIYEVLFRQQETHLKVLMGGFHGRLTLDQVVLPHRVPFDLSFVCESLSGLRCQRHRVLLHVT